jgi:adenylate cyclase class IV
MRNVEAKFRCGPELLGAVRGRALALGARPAGTLRQVDTYFRTPHGRLKLRELSGEEIAPESWLIGYTRPDEAGARVSEYEMAAVPDPAALSAVLAGTLGVRTRVAKVREVLLVRHTRIHLDAVEGLGAFVELETLVGAPGARGAARDGAASETDAAGELQELVAALGLSLAEGAPGSYADLLEAVAAERRAGGDG